MRASLTRFSVLAACGVSSACGLLSPPGESAVKLRAEEIFIVEQYLRVAEARQLAVEGSADADTRFAALAAEIPLDSIMDLAERISREHPERWRPIFQEIERRREQHR